MPATAHVANKRTPGKLVRDAEFFHRILDGSDVTATGQSAWADIGMIKDCQAHLELGTCTGTGTSGRFQVEIADDSSGNGLEVIAIFDAVDQDDDDTEAKIDGLCIVKRYVRANYTISGTSPVFPATLTLRTDKDHYNDSRSATAS